MYGIIRGRTINKISLKIFSKNDIWTKLVTNTVFKKHIALTIKSATQNTVLK